MGGATVIKNYDGKKEINRSTTTEEGASSYTICVQQSSAKRTIANETEQHGSIA
jgi:hypothetical protein